MSIAVLPKAQVAGDAAPDDEACAAPRGQGPERPRPARTAWDPVTRYRLLLEVNNAIVTQPTREELFRCLATEIRRIVAYDRFSISIHDAPTQSLSWFATADGITVKTMDDTPRCLEKAPVAHAVITSRRPVIIPDMSQYRHWETIRLMMDAGLGTTVAFPLIVRGDVVGVLHFSFRQPPPALEDLVGFLAELSGQVALAVDNTLAHTKLVEANDRLERQKRFLLGHVDDQYRPHDFITSSAAMRAVLREIELVADSDASVLLTGETGTGKDCIAHRIHQLSARRDALFVKVNCSALSESLFESELFGHVKGAFSGASESRVGRFEMANGGTVFLDEIGEIPPKLQSKLLHILQDRCFERVGDSRSVAVDFRVIAATNQDLESAIRERSFRSDLFYRLSTVSFHIPPLRDRIEEIEPLVETLTRAQAGAMHREPPTFAPGAIQALRQHSWPGNVRELKNVLTRLAILYAGRRVDRRDVEPLLTVKQLDAQPSATTLADAERAHLVRILSLTRGVVGGPKGAAALLDLAKSTLQYKLRKHALNPRDYARADADAR